MELPKIKSPFCNTWVQPKVRSFVERGKVYQEAIYTCPRTMKFIKRETVSVNRKDK